jgi:hypothetical protein
MMTLPSKFLIDLVPNIMISLPPFAHANTLLPLRSFIAIFSHMMTTCVEKLFRLTFKYRQRILLITPPLQINAAQKLMVFFQFHPQDVVTISLNNLSTMDPLLVGLTIVAEVGAPTGVEMEIDLHQGANFVLFLAILLSIVLSCCNVTTSQWLILPLPHIQFLLTGYSTPEPAII